MRRIRTLAFALTLSLVPVSPGAASMATIATTVPLQDHRERSIDAALRTALKAAVGGATAMGLPWVRINHAFVLEESVAVEILATDSDLGPDGAQEGPETDGGEDIETGALSEGSLWGPSDPGAQEVYYVSSGARLRRRAHRERIT